MHYPSHITGNFSCQEDKSNGIDQAQTQKCRYCGQPLNPLYYFCTACATPYKHPDLAVSRPALPAVASDSEILLEKVPQAKHLFFSYLGVVAIIWCMLLIFDLPRDHGLWLSNLGLLIVTLFFASQNLTVLKVQFARLGFFRWEAWFGILALVPLLFINYGITSWVEQLVQLRNAHEAIRNLEPVALFFLVVLMPGITEEVGFRGLLQHWLQVKVTPRRAIILTSCLFTALHFSIISAPYLFVLGLLLGWVKLRTGSLYPPIIMHMIHNATVIVWFT
ncbi:MAG: type II CAAX endopeptidase family protein [Lentisphaeria bacterium]